MTEPGQGPPARVKFYRQGNQGEHDRYRQQANTHQQQGSIAGISHKQAYDQDNVHNTRTELNSWYQFTPQVQPGIGCGMLHGVTVRSSVARGRVKSISFDQPPATAGGADFHAGTN